MLESYETILITRADRQADQLGFEKPKNTQYVQRTKARNLHSPFIEFGEPEFEGSYTIGELIEMLQKQVYQIEDSCIPCDLNIHYDGGTWLIVFICERDGRFKTEMFELIDALYDMVVKLKEEGVL